MNPLPESSFRLSYDLSSSPVGGVILDSLDGAAELHVEGGDFFGSGQLPNIHQGVALVGGRWEMCPAEKPLMMPALA